MTLFTAEGLLRARVRELDRGVTTCSGVTANAYLRWLRTQGGCVHPDLAMPARYDGQRVSPHWKR